MKNIKIKYHTKKAFLRCFSLSLVFKIGAWGLFGKQHQNKKYNNVMKILQIELDSHSEGGFNQCKYLNFSIWI
jgi:hypothetical protein